MNILFFLLRKAVHVNVETTHIYPSLRTSNRRVGSGTGLPSSERATPTCRAAPLRDRPVRAWEVLHDGLFGASARFTGEGTLLPVRGHGRPTYRVPEVLVRSNRSDTTH